MEEVVCSSKLQTVKIGPMRPGEVIDLECDAGNDRYLFMMKNWMAALLKLQLVSYLVIPIWYDLILSIKLLYIMLKSL